MHRKLNYLMITLFLSLSTSNALAILHIQLTQGMNQAIPIAVVPFANQQKNVPGDTTVTQVIKNDLQNSGQFRVITPNRLQPHPSKVSQVNFSYWRNKQVNDVLVGRVTALSDGGYQVQFQLIGLYNKSLKQAEKNPLSTVILAKGFDTSVKEQRQLAHYISDLVYQKLTGVRGIFTTRIAYVLVKRPLDQPSHATYALMVSDYDGFAPEKLLVSHQPISSPAWSPNGQSIAYVSFEHQRMNIYNQNIRTGHRRLISDRPGLNSSPAFSPNGQLLAMILSSTGNPKLYVMNLASGKLTQLTHGYSIDSAPMWSPDGKQIVFTSNRGGSPQLYLYSLITRQAQRLSFNGNYNAEASFFPNGQAIALMHRQSGANGLFGIAVLNLQDGQMQQIAQIGYNDESPSVSPNGKMIIYATTVGGRGILAAASPNGQVHYRMPARNGIVQDPAWSPFLLQK